MATKVKTNPLNGAHTAGIYADMTADGPILGTLVAVVDRAKNLPNRKTIGKQDPYCAARLGKEAKKTTTDVRGGQTPKWDQEIRFTVHDSPDYYQLKISIFTDDKRTDLIGEAWIDLKGIIVPGGGQNDVWQTLSCRGKYAGEIRLEITYYDTRPKPDKPAVKAKPASPAEQDSGSLRQRSPMKRRPLPSDPVTGEAPAASPPEHYQTPPRGHPSLGFVPNQSPLQAVEYNTPPPAASRHVDHYSPSSPSGAPQGHPASRQMHGPRDSYDMPSRHHEDRDYSPKAPVSPYEHADPRGSYSSLPEHYDNRDDPRQMPPGNDDVPPPPPAHRSRHNSGGQEIAQRSSLDMSPQKGPMPMRHDVLRSEAHRQSLPSYPGRPTFRAYDSAPPVVNPTQTQSQSQSFEPAPRHYSHDSTYDPHYRSMQPTVEDAPDSPTGRMVASHRQSIPRNSHEDSGHDSPAPLNLSRSPGNSAYYGTPSPMNTPDPYHGSNGYPTSVSPLAARDYDSPSQGSYQSHGGQGQQYNQRHEAEPTHFQSSASYGLPALPASLVPGVDPALSQELSERIYEERRNERGYSAPPTTAPPRGRQRSEPPVTYGAGNSPGYGSQTHDRRSGMGYGGGSELSMVRRGDVSPSGPHQTIKRKSVSPAPPPSDHRSDIPFGPDSYDALNPALAPSHSAVTAASYIDPDAKIITHDGREVDPSDHLPMDSWAPEPEPKQNSKQPSPEPRSRPSPAGAQPMPPSGRRPLRVAQRQTMPATPPSYNHPDDRHAPQTPTSTGRNRLQKKTHRTSAVPAHSASSPLAPISPDNYQDRQSPYTTPTRGQHRNSGWEYSNENHAPHGSGPPIPAKVPLPVMSGANGVSADQMALMEEMQRIDIGAGRSRRRGGY